MNAVERIGGIFIITERPAAGNSIEHYMKFVPDGELIEICIQQMDVVVQGEFHKRTILEILHEGKTVQKQQSHC